MISHSEMVKKLVKSGAQLKEEFTSFDCDLIHATLGICGEAGEILDTIKKTVIYRKELDKENIKEELGDIYFYLEQLHQAAGLTREECIQANIDKLSKRYPNFEYTDKKAKERLDKNTKIPTCGYVSEGY